MLYVNMGRKHKSGFQSTGECEAKKKGERGL